MPVALPSNGPTQGSKFTASNIALQSIPRPLRQPRFHNPDWPPAPERAPPTPTAVRVARARAISKSEMGPATTAKLPRAQQMQARALAAQAAHQRRIAGLPAEPTAKENPIREPLVDRFNQSHAADLAFEYNQFVDRDSLVPTVHYPSLNLADESDLMDEIQVDLSLPLVHQPASPLDCFEEMPFTSPSAAVDISAFMPPPGPPVLVANDETIAASAVPLADWAADFCWSLVARALPPRSPGKDHAKWVTEHLDLRPKVPVAPAFRAFVSSTLSATLPSSQCLFLGLWYLSRLPIGNFYRIPPDLDHATTPPGVLALFASLNAPSWSLKECEFREALYGKGNVYACIAGATGEEDAVQVAQLIFTLALMLGNKWLEDNTFTTRTWHDVTLLPQVQLRDLETAALGVLGFSLVIQPLEWLAWLSALRAWTAQLIAKEPIGLIDSPNGTAVSRINTLLADVKAAVQCSPAAGVKDSDDDIVLLPANDRLGSIARSRGHSRATSLPGNGFSGAHLADMANATSGWPAYALGTVGHSRRSYEAAPQDALDAFQTSAPHPALVNAGMDARKRAHQPPANLAYHPTCYLAGSHRGYRWGQVQAEMAAREKEQELFVSAWPRPSLMDWSSAWGKQPASAIGV